MNPLSPIDDYGPLNRFLASPDVSEIMVNGPNKIFIEQNGKITQVEKRFPSEIEMMRIIRQLLALVGKTLSPQTPLIDCRLTDGSRMTVTSPPVTPITCFTIRRPTSHVRDLNELVAKGSLSEAMAEFLRIATGLCQNILISGSTSCGKTTLLNAVASVIPETSRIVTIEDTNEIALPQPNWITLETAFPGRGEGGATIDMRALLSHALHLRPDRILVGEVRGAEALNMLQAMIAGHAGSMATIHASTPQDAVSRLETLVLMAGYDIPLMAVRQQIARAINLIVQMRRTTDGARGIVCIAEVTGMEDGRVKLQDVFVLDHDRATGQLGYYPTGHVPVFMQQAAADGIAMPLHLFKR